jgi:hypothetical protein
MGVRCLCTLGVALMKTIRGDVNRLPMAALLVIVLGKAAVAQAGAKAPILASAEDVRRAVLSQTFNGIELTADQHRQADSILNDQLQSVHDLDRGASDCHEKLIQIFVQRDSAWVRILTRDADKAKLIAVLKTRSPNRRC